MHECQHQPQLLLVAARVFTEAPAQVEFQPLGKFPDTRPVDAAPHRNEVRNDLAAAHPAELWQLAREISDLAFHRHRVAITVETEDGGCPGGRVDDPHEEANGGCLACTVGSE